MRRPGDILAAAAQPNASAAALCRELMELYEGELTGFTTHLGQVYEELMLLYDVGSELSATLDIDAIADLAVARVRDLLEARDGAVVLGAPDTGPDALQVLGSQPPADGLRPLLVWASAHSLARDRSLILNDLDDSGAPPAPVASLICSPLKSQGQLIGVLHVLDKDGAGGFSTEDQKLLEILATQVGATIDSSLQLHRAERHATELAEALEQLEHTYDATLEALSGALDLRDNETEGHARRVTRFTVRIALSLGVSGRELVDIERGALLHDIGKIGVPDAILLKPAKLTEEEWVVMRQHPVLGGAMIRNISFLANAAPIVLHHHERADGKGYPSGLEGDAIPLGARIFAVADTFDAMTSDRPYRKALPYEAAREEVDRCCGSQFDPHVVEAFRAVSAAEWDAIRAVVEEQLAQKRRASESNGAG